MNNIYMRWFKEHSKITVVIVAFVVLLVFILISHETFGNDNVVGRVSGNIISTVQAPLAKAGGFLSDKVSGLFTSEGLAAENARLKEELRAVENELVKEKLSAAKLAELKDLSDVLNYTDLSSNYQLVTADVIALDGSSGFNIFTINVGSDDGVVIDAVVMNGDGLIGRILSVGDNWAKVISIIDESNKIGVQVFRDFTWLGVCQGDGKGQITGYMIDDKAVVLEGDKLLTSGIGGVYPQGLSVGHVTKVEWNQDAPLKKVTVEPDVNFKNIRKVTVLI